MAIKIPGVASPFDLLSIGTSINNLNNANQRRASARRIQSMGVAALADTSENPRERDIRDSEANPTASSVNLSATDEVIITNISPSDSNGSQRSESFLFRNIDRSNRTGSVPPNHEPVVVRGGTTAGPHSCTVCGRSFSTKSGLGVHIRRAHPDDSDRMNVRTDKKARWNDEEISLLACIEAELTHSGGVRFMNHALHERFVHRSIEAIKKARQKSDYKVKVQTYLSRISASTDGQIASDALVHSHDVLVESSNIASEVNLIVDDPLLESQPVVADPIQDFLLSLSDLETDSYSAPYLNSIVRSVNENDKDLVLHRLSGYIDEIFPPNLHTRRQPRRIRATPVFTNRRRRRRHEYAQVQRNWRKHNTRCIKAIIDDTESTPQPPREVMEPYWKAIFERVDESEPPREDLSRHLEGEVWVPIVEDIILGTIPSLTTSPGIDGITSRQVRAIPFPFWIRIFNLMMWCGKVPRRLRVARTIFLAKKQKPSLPEDFRPITLSSIIIRWFHAILAKRLSKCINFERRQKGFMPTDGCAENTTLIDLLLRDHHQRYASCHMAVLDVSKAFDSLSHNAIMSTLGSYGLPQVLVDYVRHVYSSGYIKLSGDTWESDQLILPGRGVKQGDPLSPVLFNLVMDRLIRRLPPELGCRIGNYMTNIAAFADDLIIWSSTQMGLQKLLDIVSEFLRTCGLQLNCSKCLSLSIQGQPKQKRSVVVQKEFTIAGRTIPALKRTDEWKYLGVTFTADGRTKVDLKKSLIEKLDRLTRAPLKPQQRLFALRTVLIPQLYHVLTLGNVMIGCLNGIDKILRAYVRKWLSLPNDVPIAFFYALVKDGGLGIVALRWQAPLIRLNRLQGLQLPLPSGIESADTFIVSEVAKVERRLNTGASSIRNRNDMTNFWAKRLHESFDGRGLINSKDCAQCHRWIREPTRLMSGKDFIQCIKLRINALPSKSRCSRGRTSDRRCRAGCNAPETLNHIVQGCYVTKKDRMNRHDKVVNYIGRNLRNQGFRTDIDKSLQTNSGIKKPDIIAYNGDKIYVLDAQVVTDSRNLADMHKTKQQKYDRPEIIRAIRDRYGDGQLHFGAITLNWRGIWCRDSVSDLTDLRIIRYSETALISIRVMIGGCIAHRRFSGSLGSRSGIG